MFITLCSSYNLIYFILTYLIPLVVMGLCYLQMGRKLWGEKTIGEDTPSLAKSRKTKQKVFNICREEDRTVSRTQDKNRKGERR